MSPGCSTSADRSPRAVAGEVSPERRFRLAGNGWDSSPARSQSCFRRCRACLCFGDGSCRWQRLILTSPGIAASSHDETSTIKNRRLPLGCIRLDQVTDAMTEERPADWGSSRQRVLASGSLPRIHDRPCCFLARRLLADTHRAANAQLPWPWLHGRLSHDGARLRLLDVADRSIAQERRIVHRREPLALAGATTGVYPDSLATKLSRAFSGVTGPAPPPTNSSGTSPSTVSTRQ